MSITEPNHLRYLGDLKCFVIGSFIAYYHCGHERFLKEQKEEQLRQRQASSCVSANSLPVTFVHPFENVPLVEFMYLVLSNIVIVIVIAVPAHYICTSIWGCTSGGVYVPCFVT